jgi:hypothetical protein
MLTVDYILNGFGGTAEGLVVHRASHLRRRAEFSREAHKRIFDLPGYFYSNFIISHKTYPPLEADSITGILAGGWRMFQVQKAISY